MFHIDYTLNFWTLVAQAVATGSLITFLYHAFKAIMSVVNAIKAMVHAVRVILDEHREVYLWYQSLREGKATTLPDGS